MLPTVAGNRYTIVLYVIYLDTGIRLGINTLFRRQIGLCVYSTDVGGAKSGEVADGLEDRRTVEL